MSSKRALFHLCLSQSVIGVSIICAKYLVTTIPIIFLLFLRFGFSSILLLIVCRLFRYNLRNNSFGQPLGLDDLFMISLQAIMGGFLYNVLMLNGLMYTNATVAGIISSTTPAMIAVLSVWLLNENISPRKMLMIALAIIGIMFMHLGSVSDQNPATDMWGNLLVLFAIIPEAMFTIIAKKHNTPIPSLVIAVYSNIVNAVITLPLALSIMPSITMATISPFDWLIIATLVISNICFFYFFYLGIPYLAASTTALMTAIAPISITLLAHVILGERIGLMGVLGLVFVLASIIFGAGSSDRPPRKQLTS